MKIRILARDTNGDCMFHLKMSNYELAMQVFNAITHDSIHQDVNWYLETDGTIDNWHCPIMERAAV